LLETYLGLLQKLKETHFDEDLYFQRIPSFRVHLPGNAAVATPHRDTDGDHSPREVNVYLPVTRAYGTNTLWTESELDKQDFAPLVADPGELIVWNGANLLHHNKVNDTEQTRVSIDFRLIRVADYVHKPDLVSLTMRTPIAVGHYFDRSALK